MSEQIICYCDNCGYEGVDYTEFMGPWSEWINCQDVNAPVILPIGDCPKCDCTVYAKEAAQSLTLGRHASKLLESLNGIYLKQKAFQKAAEDQRKLKGAYRNYGPDDYFAEMFPLIEEVRLIIDKVRPNDPQ